VGNLRGSTPKSSAEIKSKRSSKMSRVWTVPGCRQSKPAIGFKSLSLPAGGKTRVFTWRRTCRLPKAAVAAGRICLAALIKPEIYSMSVKAFRLYCRTSNAPTSQLLRLHSQHTLTSEKALGHGTFAPATRKTKATGSRIKTIKADSINCASITFCIDVHQ
jgi:hypothetical protein